jgi:hypothetical protein
MRSMVEGARRAKRFATEPPKGASFAHDLRRRFDEPPPQAPSSALRAVPLPLL